MTTKIKTYRQDRDAIYLEENPHETWRCDIFPDDRSDHHGVGSTESFAIMQAALAYCQWEKVE